jgi:O-antigen/teichoic acid export membrane protein/glycosyltransferase involved in cell wall biosynthesis
MLKNIFSNWIGLIVLGTIGAILTPVMMHGLGDLYYGMWVLIGSFIDYSGLLDMGMRATVFRYVAFFKGANQREPLNETFTTGVVISFSAMCIETLAFVGLSFILPRFFKFTGHDKTVFMWTIILMGTALSVALPGQFLFAYLRGLERFDLYNMGLVIHGVFRGSTLLLLLKFGYGIIYVSAAVLILEVLFLIFRWFLVMWSDPELKFSLKCLNWHRTREMFSFGFYSFVYNSGETLRYSTDSFVIGRMLNVALVTPFSVATRLMEYFKVLTGGVSGPLMVRITGLTGKNQQRELRTEFLRSTRFSMLLCIFIGDLLIVNGKTLIRLWVGPSYLMSYSILVVLTVAYIPLLGQTPSSLLVFAHARQHRALSWWTLGEGAVNLGLSIWWAGKYGLLGVALGTAIPLVVSKVLVQPCYALRDLGITWWRYFRQGLARPLFAGGLFLALSWFLTSRFGVSSNFTGLALTCICQTSFFAGLTYMIGLSEVDKGTVRELGRKLATALGVARSSQLGGDRNVMLSHSSGGSSSARASSSSGAGGQDLRILTTHPKGHYLPWIERTVMLRGWLTDVDRVEPNSLGFWRSLGWGWKLFRASRDFDAVVTGNERAIQVFAMLQQVVAREKKPHILIYAFFDLPPRGFWRFVKRLYFQWLIKASSRIVVYSRRRIDLYARVFDVPKEKFVCVPYHTTLDNYHATFRITDSTVSEMDYIFAGGDYRDYRTFLDAVRDLPYEVIIATRLKDYFAGLDIPKNVRVITASHEEFFQLMAGARVVVVPLHGGVLHSGGEQTYLNAMALGKPVIVADDGGADEYISNGLTGLVVRPGDAKDLRWALLSVLDNPSLASSLGQNAKGAAAAYSLDRFVQGILVTVEACVDHGEK